MPRSASLPADVFAFAARLLEFTKADFDRVERIEQRVVGQSAIDFTAARSSGQRVYGRIEAWRDGIVRLRLAAAPLASRSTPMVVASPSPSSAAASEDSLASEPLRVVLERDPFGFVAHDQAGRVLVRDEHEDRRAFGSGHVAFPFGFVTRDTIPCATGALALAGDELIYGFGEKFGPLERRGRAITCCNRGSGAWTSGEHKNIPLALSSRGYGLFFNSTCPMRFDVGAASNASFTFAVAEPEIDLFVLAGPSFKQIIERYTWLTGRPPELPAWSYGVWMSRHTYTSARQIEETCDRFRAEQLPCDVIKIDTGWFHQEGRGSAIDFDMEWNRAAFPQPEAFLANLRERGFHVALFVNSWVLAQSPRAIEARSLGYLVKRPDGSEHTWNMGENCPVVAFDLTNPSARAWYQEQLGRLLRQGVSTFFADWGVDAPITCDYHSFDPLAYNNAHGLIYLQTVYEALREHAKGPAVLWGVAGTAGVQRFPTTYGGDSRTTFRDMANVLRGGLSASLSGIAHWSCDIGGFGRAQTEPPDPRLYIRYLQHGMMLSQTEFHGMGPREPWHFGPQAIEAYRTMARLRYSLIPYLTTCAAIASATGCPILRPMVLEFQHDPNCAHLDLQYMLGPSLLVAPIFDESTRRLVYLPEGLWYDHWTGEPIESAGRWIDVDAPLDRIPLFVRGGSAIPMATPASCVAQMSFDELFLDLYPAPGEHTAHIALPGEPLRQFTWTGDGASLRLALPPIARKITPRVHPRRR